MREYLSTLSFLRVEVMRRSGNKYLEILLGITPPIQYTDTSVLPGICRHARCYRDVVKLTNHCAAHQPKPKSKPPSWVGLDVVYMVGIEGEPYIKVGFASELSSRMIGMQVSSPKKLMVLAVFAGNQITESLMHRELQEHHVRGEWFDYDEAKALAARLGVSETLRAKLGVRDVICRFVPEGYHWDAKGLPTSALKKSRINSGHQKI